MTYYTYPVQGFGFLPDPDNVQDWDTLEDAYGGFLADIETTCEHKDTDTPTDIPSLEDARNAMPGGLAYAYGGWIHVIGQD